MTDIGGSAVLSEASVDAGNWMTALKLARAAVGESGGVPPGASCQVAPDGRVTIHDAVARKTYTLAPDTQSSLKPAAKPAAPQIPADRVPRPSSVPPPSQVMAGVDKSKKAPQRTIAYDARELGLATAQAPAAPAAAPVPQTTIAYDAKEMGVALAAAAAAAPVAPAPAKKKKKKLPAQTIAYDAAQMGLAPAAPAPAQKAPQQTIAYDAKEMGLAPAAAPAASPAPKKKAPAHTIAYDAKEMGLMAPEAPATAPEPPAPEPPTPEPPTLEPPADEARMTQPDGVGGAPQTLVLMHSRDADPTPESPLCYRERIYYVPEVPSEYVLEALLSAQFEELRAELESRPKGKLVNLALFDHEWKGRPQGPPLLTLQWKDWRGEPVIQKPGQSAPPAAASTPPAAPVSTPPAAAAPAPSSPAEVWRSAPPPAQSAPPPAAPVSAPPPAQSAPPPAQSAPPPAAPVSAPPPAQSAPPPPAQSAPPPAQSAPPPAQSAPPPAQSAPPPAAPISAPPPAARVSQPAPAAAPAPSQPAPPRAAAPARAAATAEPQSDDRLVTAFEALQDLFFLTTPMEGVNFVMQLLDDLIPSEAKSVCLYDINTDELRFVSLTGPGAEERQGEGVPRLSGLLGVAALSPNHTVLVEDASSDERFDPGVDGRLGLSVETLAVVALSHQGRLLGVLQLINRQEQMQYSRADGNLMHYIAEKLGEFLHAARLRPHPRA